jgi:hypothetical protein
LETVGEKINDSLDKIGRFEEADVLSMTPGAVRYIPEPQGIKSLLMVPRMCNGECIGFIGFDSVKMHRECSEGEQHLLIFSTRMLVSVRQRKLAEGEFCFAGIKRLTQT